MYTYALLFKWKYINANQLSTVTAHHQLEKQSKR